MQKKWYRSRKNKMIGGVAGGLAEYFDVDPTIIRLLFVVGLFMGAGFLAYIILWIVVPEEPYYNEDKTKSETNTQNSSAEQSNSADGGIKEDNNKTNTPRKNKSHIFGAILVIFGVLLLIDNFVTFHAFWPLLLILLGVGILLNSRRN